jgi:hypothetical protein
LLLGTGVIYYVFNVPAEYTNNIILEWETISWLDKKHFPDWALDSSL